MGLPPLDLRESAAESPLAPLPCEGRGEPTPTPPPLRWGNTTAHGGASLRITTGEHEAPSPTARQAGGGLRRRSVLGASASAGVGGLLASCGDGSLPQSLLPKAGSPLKSLARATPSSVWSDVEPWGTNLFLHKEVEAWKRDLTVEMVRDAGITWAKQHFPWEEIEQPRKGQWFDAKYAQSTWDKFDEIVRIADARGLRLIARIDRPPAWARVDKSRPNAPPDRIEDFGDFAFQLAARYRGKVEHFQVWNEPNLGEEWTGRPDPTAYVALLRVAYKRIKEANPNACVLAAPLAMNVEVGPIHLNEIDYLDRMYQAGAKDVCDVVSANAYGMDRPPEDPPNRAILNFRRVELLRAVMERNGDGAKATWFNEFGWNASPRDMPREELVWQRVTDRQQAEWTVEGVEYARQNWPWAGVFCTWYFRQVGDISPSRSEYYFRLVDPDFTPRPVYHAVRAAARAR